MKKQGQICVCVKCKRLMKISARGLCNTCYDKDIKARKIRKCKQCGEIRPHHSHGLCYRCAEKSNYYAKHEHKLKQAKDRYQKNKSKFIEKDHARNKTDKRRAWQQKRNQEQYILNGDKLREYQRQYRANHPGFVTHHVEKYKARKANLPDDLTQEQWKRILENHHYTCHYCGASGINLVREHKIPVSRGGGYTASNIVPACNRCNNRKHNMTDVEFFAFLKKFPR